MSLPPSATGVFMTCASGSLVCISSSMVSMVQIADRELLKNPGVIAVFYGQFLRFLKLTAYFIFMIFRIVLGISMLSFKAPNCRAWQPMA